MKHLLPFLIILALFSFSNLTEAQNLRRGDKAPELKYMNPEGKEMSLSELEGKIVLIDFWASWCGPCRRANPKLVSLYEKYANSKYKDAKGFEIFSVSLDQSKEAWTNAIIKDNLDWDFHVSDLKKWNSEAAKLYGVRKIPTSFLLNEDGVIIGIDLSPSDIEFELKRRQK